MVNGAIRIEDTFPLERWEALDAFLARAYSPAYVLRRRPLLAWMYRLPDRDDAVGLLCAWRGEELLAILGHMPTRVFWGSLASPLEAAWIANWISLPGHRIGLGWPLLRRMLRMYPVVLGHGASKQNIEIATRLGFALHPGIPRWVRVLDQDAAALLLAQNPAAPARTLPQGQPGPGAGGGLSREVRYAAPPLLPQDYAPDWTNYPALAFGAVRDAAYLEYKYLRHPCFTYRMAYSGPRRTPAVCVYRIETSSGAAKINAGRIVEFFHPRTREGAAHGRAVLDQALEDMAGLDCAFADFICTSQEFDSALQGAGFFLDNEALLPERLSPVVFSSDPGRRNVEFFAGAGLRMDLAMRDLYVTKSDGDQDRPNFAYGDADA